MWRRRAQELPFASGGRAPPKNLKQLRIPQVTWAQCISWAWTGCGVLLILLGIGYCRRYSESTTLKCDVSSCTFTANRPDVPQQLVTFPRQSLVRAEQVKLRNGEIAELKGIARRKQNMLPQSYSVTWQYFADDGKILDSFTEPMSRRGLGRRRPRECVQEVMAYVRHETNSLDISETKWASALGIVFLILGSMLLLTRLAVGNLGEAFDGNAAPSGGGGSGGIGGGGGGGGNMRRGAYTQQRYKKRG